MNHLQNRRRLVTGLATSLLAVLTASTVAMAPNSAADDKQVREWSTTVWRSAVRGDVDRLEEQFANLPKVEASPDAESFREALARRAENIGRSVAAREEARAEAMGELEQHLDAGELSQALRAAVTVQSFSDDLSDALDDPSIRKVISMASEAIPGVEERGDWLYAQELQYRLRTLYEDADRDDAYVAADEHLDWINRRVALLATFAPRHLHDLRNKAAERNDEDELPEFNPNLVVDWRERVADITPTMLKTSLRAASREHIEADGYRPLLYGGLLELKVLSTTSELSESFPGLGDEQARRTWVNYLNKQIDHVTNAKEDELDSLTLSRVLDGLAFTNNQTVELPRSVLYHAFGEGAMYELDPYSEIVWPAALRRFQQSTEGNFVGVGILIRHNEKREIEVVNPLEGTPAYFAGVKPGDRILAVNGDSTVGWSLNDAVDRITGKRGTTVRMTLRREGVEDDLEIPITREVIKLRSVQGWWKDDLDENGDPNWDWYVDSTAGIAYIRLTQFTEDSYSDLLAAWREINEQGTPRGLIFDMRFNPGGLLDAAVRISNLFLDRGMIVSGENKEGLQAWQLRAQPNQAAWRNVPTVVLVNKGSASASEIVSGCLQAHGAAVVVGERSFGKGSVQSVLPITQDSRLKLTTQYFRIPPNVKKGETVGRLIHKRPHATEWGVDPDILVKMTPKQVIDSVELRREADVIPLDEQGNQVADSSERPDVMRLLNEGIDPQLEMALLILQARALADNVAANEVHARR